MRNENRSALRALRIAMPKAWLEERAAALEERFALNHIRFMGFA